MVNVRLMGTFKEATGKQSLILKGCKTVGSVILKLIELSSKDFKNFLLDPVMQSPLPNALILVNGVEVNNLEGLGTLISDDDEIVLLSITHGG